MIYQNDFYQNLNKPVFTPKPKVFRIVWSVLYGLMTISFIMLLMNPNSFYKLAAIIIFISQLFFNFLYSPVFFIFKKIKVSFLISILLVFLILILIIMLLKISLLSAVLLIPYLLWLIFASILNYYIVKLN